MSSGQILLDLWPAGPSGDLSSRCGADVEITQVKKAGRRGRAVAPGGRGLRVRSESRTSARLRRTTTLRRCRAEIAETTTPRRPCVCTKWDDGSQRLGIRRRGGQLGAGLGRVSNSAYSGRGSEWWAGPVI